MIPYRLFKEVFRMKIKILLVLPFIFIANGAFCQYSIKDLEWKKWRAVKIHTGVPGDQKDTKVVWEEGLDVLPQFEMSGNQVRAASVSIGIRKIYEMYVERDTLRMRYSDTGFLNFK